MTIEECEVASLPVGDQNDNHTTTAPERTYVPDFESSETKNVNKGKTRYRLAVFKNEDGAESLISATVQSLKPAGTDTATGVRS